MLPRNSQIKRVVQRQQHELQSPKQLHRDIIIRVISILILLFLISTIAFFYFRK